MHERSDETLVAHLDTAASIPKEGRRQKWLIFTPSLEQVDDPLCSASM